MKLLTTLSALIFLLFFTGCGGGGGGGTSGSTDADNAFLYYPPSDINMTEQPLLIVRIEFLDYTFVNDEAAWAQKIYGTMSSQLNDYYLETTYDQFKFIPAQESDATVNDGIVTVQLNENHPGNVDDFVTRLVDAIALANAHVDFSLYDKNGNGAVDLTELQIMFLVAGGESAYGDNPGIWAHAWCLYGQYGADAPTVDGVKVMECASEGSYSRFGERHGDHDATIGIIAHELGHARFLLPDLYDVDGSSDGIGNFGLMGAGMWTYQMGENAGATPVHFCGWSKKHLGFVVEHNESVLTNVALRGTDDQNFTMMAIETANAGEYFLLENRPNSGYDRGFYALDVAAFNGGLAIWHIDENQETPVEDNNDNADDTHRMVDLEEANNPTLDLLDGDRGNRTNFYYLGNNDAFTPVTTPSSLRYDGGNDNIEVTNISLPGATMYIDVTLP